MARHPIRAWILIIGLMLPLLPAEAKEPEGWILFETEGVAAPPAPAPGLDPGERPVILTLRVRERLLDAVLLHSTSGQVSQRLIAMRAGGTERIVSRSDGASPGSFPIGMLEPGVPVTLEFAVSFAEDGGGTVLFTIQTAGRPGPIREAFSLAVGTPSDPGVLRDGAIEYPAHVLPEDTP